MNFISISLTFFEPLVESELWPFVDSVDLDAPLVKTEVVSGFGSVEVVTGAGLAVDDIDDVVVVVVSSGLNPVKPLKPVNIDLLPESSLDVVMLLAVGKIGNGFKVANGCLIKTNKSSFFVSLFSSTNRIGWDRGVGARRKLSLGHKLLAFTY